MLQSCLASLEQMERPDGACLTVTVIDNDFGGSALDVVNEFRGRVDFDVVYRVEEKRGIPCARNRALDVTRELQSDMIVFIDDDETVRSNWLVRLLEASQHYGHQAAVHGLVVPQLDAGVPPDVSGLFNSRKRIEGQQLSACATDNVIVPMTLINRHGLRFDESRPLAGGTDTVFFTQAGRLGMEIYQTNQAVVDETIPKSRTNLKWLTRRKFRSGLTDAWRKLQKGRARPVVATSALFHIVASLLKVLFFSALMSGLRRNESLLAAAKYTGVLMGCVGFHVDSYKVIDK